jgi:hypothetical protein
MQHHKGSRNLADNAGKVIKNLKKKEFWDFERYYVWLGSRELVRINNNFFNTGSFPEMYLINQILLTA